MEKACVTAATGALGPVVAKLDTLLQRRHGEYKLRRGTRKDIKVIRYKLNSIHSILWVIWEREDLDAARKELRIEAWRLADDMNDDIDDFILSMKRSNNGRQFMEDKTQPSPFQDLKRRTVDVWERCHNKWKKKETAHTTLSSLFSRTKATCDVQDTPEDQVMRNVSQHTPGVEVEPLVEAYNHLPHHMKTCLLYSSIYSEGHQSFRMQDLVAEGFVCKEAAQDYLNELVSRGFILEDVMLPGSAVKRLTYKVHPRLRNYLRQKLRENNFITCTSDGVPSTPIIGRLCIDYWPASSDDAIAVDPLSGIDWHHIRSLVVFKDAEKVPYKHLKHLRVLDIPCYQVLENQHVKDMCGLLRLRHLLGLHGERITEIPAEIVRLQYLETLEVTGTNIKRLPAEIGDLKQLKTLDLSLNGGLSELPREVANLQHTLERLRICGSNLREDAWETILTLKKLKTLDVSYNNELSGIPRDIGKLQQLTDLNLCWNPRITELPKEIERLQQLKKLDITRTGITELPREIGNLQHLEALYLRDARKITKLPRDIGRLQHLEELDLWETNVRKIPREIGGLKKLKNLNAEIGKLPFEAGQLPELEGLPRFVQEAWKNNNLVSLVAGEVLSIEKIDAMIGDGGLIVGTKHMHIPPWIKEHFNRIGSLDIRICKLEEPDLKILREMPDLCNLKLRFEAVPREPIIITSGGFANLSCLTIDSQVPRITFQKGAMPRLFFLAFEFQFYSGPANTDPVGIKHLVNLRFLKFQCTEWYREDSACISAMIDVVRKEAWEGPNELMEFSLSVGGEKWHFVRPEIAESSQAGFILQKYSSPFDMKRIW